MRQVRQRVALRVAAIVGDLLVAAGKADRLERQEPDALGIVERELNDASDLLVVDAVDDGHDRHDFDASAMQVVDSLQLHIEQVADLAVCVGSVANAVELQVGVTHAGFSGLLSKLKALRELDAIGCSLYRVVSNLACVTNCVQEIW